MKDLYTSLVNKRIQAGNLPHCELHVAPSSVDSDSHIPEKARPGMAILQANPDFLLYMMQIFSSRAQEISNLTQSELFERDFNFLINTDYSIDSVNLIGAAYKKSTALLPFVTFLDKVLWCAIQAYDFDIMCQSNQQGSEKESLFYAWISILKIVQRKEQRHGKTIDLSRICNSTPLFELLCGNTWSKFEANYFIDLSATEMSMFTKLQQGRNSLQREISTEISAAKLVATETQESWEQFIDIVNSLSLQESTTIANMVDTSLSKREKLCAIQNYNSILYSIRKHHYQIRNDDIPLVDLFESVQKRFQSAPAYCCVQDAAGDTFRVWPTLPMLLMQPETYNYLYIVYHQFRLEPKKDIAKQFAELALSCLYRNLGIPKSASSTSISNIVTDFYITTTAFIEQHRDAIEKLSFDTLQQDSVLSNGASLSNLGTEEYEKFVTDYISSIQSNSSAPLPNQVRSQNREKFLAQLDKEIQRFKMAHDAVEEAQVARQIVVSLNIIYMFCGALRIMLTNKRAHIDFSNKSAVMNIRYDLLEIDSMLIRKVYSNSKKILHYRESTGISAETISDVEAQEEQHRTILFFSELQSIVNELVSALEKQSTSRILEIKQDIQRSILELPICELTEQGAEWLDSISDRISAALVNNCKYTSSHFEEVKQLLQSKLGAESQLLPQSTLASLVTAELLYEEYASSDYAAKGFDYSCISALYYQAFEEAYNKLIWSDYADRLNSLPIDGIPYTDILDQFKNKYLANLKAQGYLDERGYDRGFYIDYKSKNKSSTAVKRSCMYGNFARLMAQVTATSKLDKFCEYIAEITGYPNAQSMFSDTFFTKKLAEFALNVDLSKDNRNNASHGGTAIDIAQCDADKKVVLNGLEAVRKESLGLIQQLLYLMRNKPH